MSRRLQRRLLSVDVDPSYALATGTDCRDNQLETVVGVDVEAKNRSDFRGLVAAHGGFELPTAQGGDDFRRHVGGAGFEYVHVFHVARSIERALNHHAGTRQTLW